MVRSLLAWWWAMQPQNTDGWRIATPDDPLFEAIKKYGITISDYHQRRHEWDAAASESIKE